MVTSTNSFQAEIQAWTAKTATALSHLRLRVRSNHTLSIRLRTCEVPKAMPSILLAAKLSLTFGASVAISKNSFSVFKNIFIDQKSAFLAVTC